MGKYSEYVVPLRGLKEGTHKFEYKLTNEFFSKIDDPELQKGKVNVLLNVKKTGETYELDFEISGVVQVSCDRCLDDMDQPIETQEKLYVKFGKEFSEEDDNIVIIPFDEGEINVAWFIFEFISLNIPIKHVHPFGKCNKEMTSKLKQVSTYEKDDDDDNNSNVADDSFDDSANNMETDPRWDELKKLIDNN